MPVNDSSTIPIDVGTGGWSVGDFDGEGTLDVFRYVPGSSGADMYHLDGTELVHQGSWTDSWNGGPAWVVGDFNGDGRDDIFRLLAEVSPADVFLSTGEAFSYAGPWLGTDMVAQRWHVGDFNGDGKDDIFRLVPGSSGADVYLSDGSAFVSSGSWTGYGPGNDGWFVGDFDGDGRSDIMRHVPGLAGAEVLLSTGTAFGAGRKWASIGPVGQWTVMDMNGDGKDDLVDDIGNILVSDGSKFDLIGRLDLSLDQRVLGVQLAGDRTSADILIYDSSVTGADSLSVRPVDLIEGLVDVPEVVFQDLPRVGYTGTSLNLSFEAVDPAYQVRVVAIHNGETGYSDWSDPSSYTLTFEQQGDYLFSFELRDKESGKLVQEQAGGRTVSVYAPEHGIHLAAFSRLEVHAIDSPISQEASTTEWRGDISSFTDLYGHVNDAFEAANSGMDDGTLAPSLSKALYMLQFVSGMWAYGNAGSPQLPGEVTDNEIAGETAPEDVTAELFINSPIAGCEDYAAVLGVMLTLAGFENRIVLNPAHVFNEVSIDGEWWTLDATFGWAVDQPFDAVLQQDTTPAILMFSHVSRLASNPHYRERAAEGIHEFLAQVDHGIFLNANRYSTIDYFNIFPYGEVFTSEIDTGDWAPSSPVQLLDDPDYGAADLDAFLTMTSLERLTLADHASSVSFDASTSEWRQDITTYDALLAHVDDAFAATGSDNTPLNRSIFYMEWVSGVWGLGDSIGATDDGSVQALLARSTASSEDRAALLGWMLTAAGFENRVAVEQGAAFNEVLVDSRWHTLDATSGLNFDGAWLSVIDTATRPEVSVSPVAGRMDGPLYSSALANLFHETLVRVANGSFSGNETINVVDWLAARPYGHALLAQLDDTAPGLLSVTRTDSAIDIEPGVTALSFEILFSEYVSLQSDDLHVKGSTAGITDIVDKGDGKYLVTISGGDISDIKTAIRLELSQANDITDHFLNPLSDELGDVIFEEYRATQVFVPAGAWTSATPPYWYTGDFNGDGKSDVFAYAPGRSGADMHISEGTSFAASGSWTTAWNGNYNWHVGDFNGDGKDDIFRYLLGSSGADVLLSDGESFVSSGSWTPAGQGTAGWHIGDFNGDGKDDIFRYVPGSSGAEMFLSDGTSFVRDASWTSAGHGAGGWHVGDFNGDGKDDILRNVPGSSSAEVFLSNGTSFVRDQSWLSSDHAGNWQVGDFDGDGLDDLLGMSADGKAEIYRSDGNQFNASEFWSEKLTSAHSWTFGDFNGDGKFDAFLDANQNNDAQMLLTDWFYM